MRRLDKPNPYDFKSDTERRKALATLVRWRYSAVMVSAVAFAASGHSGSLMTMLRHFV